MIVHVLVLTLAGFTIGLVDTDTPLGVHIQGPSARTFPGLPPPRPPPADMPCFIAELIDADTIARLIPAVCTVQLLEDTP